MKLFYVVRYQGPATTRWPASYKSLPVHLKGGENSQIAHFCKLCCNLLLFRKYVEIYYFLGTRVWRNWVFYDTRFNGTREPWKNFENFLWYLSTKKFFWQIWSIFFSKNMSFWNSSFTANLSFTNSSFKKVVDLYIFPKQ